jgi:hypothetical protein
MEERKMYKRIILITIPILLVAMLLVGALPAKEEVKPMVYYTAKEQMCKVIKEGTVVDIKEGNHKEAVNWQRESGQVMVCQNTSDDPMVAGKVTLKTITGWHDLDKNNYGWTVYETKLETKHGTWKGVRIASTDTKGVTYTNGKAWGVGSLGNRPTSNGWQMWYKMTEESPAIITGKYTAEFEKDK